jgi:hypothetical protein
MATTYGQTNQNVRADAGLARMNNGTLRLYNGTIPTNARTALSGNTLLAQGTFGATAFPASSGANGGSSTSNAITGANATASGTPTFARAYNVDGTTCEAQWAVGAEVTVSPAALTSGVNVTYGNVVHTENN